MPEDKKATKQVCIVRAGAECAQGHRPSRFVSANLPFFESFSRALVGWDAQFRDNEGVEGLINVKARVLQVQTFSFENSDHFRSDHITWLITTWKSKSRLKLNINFILNIRFCSIAWSFLENLTPQMASLRDQTGRDDGLHPVRTRRHLTVFISLVWFCSSPQFCKSKTLRESFPNQKF